jgi:hypothetical protein
MRSSFNLAVSKLKENGTDASSLGLQIGFEYGPMNVTRLGMKGELIRCSVSRGVIAAEKEQGRCTGNETAIGPVAYSKASDAVRAMFGQARKRAGLDYDTMIDELSAKNDSAVKAARTMASAGLLKPATTPGQTPAFPNRQTGPSKPAGFA